MSWPAWIDEIARRYLADEASVFLVHGDVTSRRWEVEGQLVDAAQALVLFLRRTREVVAVLRPGPPPARLEFAAITDRQKFENLVRAADLMHGSTLTADESDPFQALGRVWRALTTTGTAQGYIVSDTERLLPYAKRFLDKVPGAPDLFGWPAHPTLRRSNNLMVFLARSADAVRAELATAACAIPIDLAPAAVEELPLSAMVELELEPEPAAPAAPEAPAAPSPSPAQAPAAAGGDLRADLERALVRALCNSPEEARPALVPVMQAVADVVAARRPDRFRPVALGVDEEGRVTVEGDGADAFVTAWKGDIALGAAGGMILKELKGGFSEARPPALDATGVGALVRRVERLLR